MTFSEHLILLIVLLLVQNNFWINGSAIIVKRENNETIQNGSFVPVLSFQKSFFSENEERNLEQEIFQELNHLSARKQREIFDDLEKQQKSFVLSEPENLSPLNVEELKSIRKTIKTSNSSFPVVRNKRTLNLLLSLVARAMGYTLTPTNPDAEWIPRQRPQPSTPPPCPTTPPPCRPNPPSPSPPCAMPPTAPPCRGTQNAMQTAMQPATIAPNLIDANTISYPFRPARTIPLLNFAPLPQGIRVPYPPLLQPQRAPCSTPAPPCSTPAPSPPPCGTTPAPSPPPCATTPAPRPPPCGTTPAPSPPPCTMPAPSPPPCATPPPKPAPCATPAPSPPPCATTPAPSPPPCATPAPTPAPCATPAPSPPPCAATPAPKPPPCAPAPPPPPPPPSQKPPNPKKGSILLEYEDPVRIKIFSNDKKYLPASGNLYRGEDDGYEEKVHSYYFPRQEDIKKKNEDVEEEEEEMQEEHVEEEEDDGSARQEEEEEEENNGKLKHYEEEDERTLANNEEEDESETNLSIVKKPAKQNLENKKKRRIISTKNAFEKTKEKDKKEDKTTEDKTLKMKKPKKKKWVRIVKKQRKTKTKTDVNPQENFHVYTSDNIPDDSLISQKVFGRSVTQRAFHSFEKDFPDFGNSGSHSHENLEQLELKKVIINDREITSPDLLRGARRYELDVNPYTPETEESRRKKLEKAVEKYVEAYVEKQLGDELLKNTGVPKTTVFEFAPKNGPKIKTITTTVAKTTTNGYPNNFKPQLRPEPRIYANTPPRQSANVGVVRKNNYEENNSKRRGNLSYEAFATRS